MDTTIDEAFLWVETWSKHWTPGRPAEDISAWQKADAAVLAQRKATEAALRQEQKGGQDEQR